MCPRFASDFSFSNFSFPKAQIIGAHHRPLQKKNLGKFIFILAFVFVCLCVCAMPHGCRYSQKQEEAISSLEVVVTGGCKLLDMGGRN